jgi:capsular polysaccharide export protein
VEGASQVIVDADDELAAIAAMAGVPVRCVGAGPFAAVAKGRAGLLEAMSGSSLGGAGYIDPFTAGPIPIAQAVELCAFWRRLIDDNRTIKAAIGFAAWKRPTVAPLLWAGSDQVPFTSTPPALNPEDEVAVWKSRTSAPQLAALSKVKTVEVEDGFIRSIGLGADCVPPLSIIFDRSGVYFDPHQPSDLEQLLQEGDFSSELLDRARRLRRSIVESGISKYEAGGTSQGGRPEGRRHLLVVGQVEDDRSVRCGGGPVQTNLELLRRVREGEPDAFISYKPHPDVQAGHRTGRVTEDALATLADQLVQSGSISSWIDMVDEIHVNTSLAGFEALLRGKPVTTHGVPFYAGWGLTRDLGDVPARRTARRSLDELVAATLLQYPRYLDPLTGLPCPAETLVLRIAEGGVSQGRGILVRLRQLQGQLKRRLSMLRTRVFG